MSIPLSVVAMNGGMNARADLFGGDRVVLVQLLEAAGSVYPQLPFYIRADSRLLDQSASVGVLLCAFLPSEISTIPPTVTFIHRAILCDF